MMSSPLRIVYLEDDPADVQLVRDALDDNGLRTELIAVDKRDDFLAAIEQGPDLVLADYALPTFNGMEALALCRERCPERPFIFVTGAVGEERAIETFKSGAKDYVLKTRLSRLGFAVRRAVAEAEEVAERKRVVEQLSAAIAAAESANQAKSQFLANISHELRTPMNAILGMIDLALTKAADPVIQDCLQTAKGSADLLLTLLDDLLDSAKIESGKLELEAARFSLRRTLDQITRVLSTRASEKGLCFHCRVPEATPDALIGDRLRLQQIRLNLAGNAIKFTDKGEVEVGVRLLPSTTGRGAGGEGEGTAHLEFTVRDTGIGIPPVALERLFQPFAQGDPSMARRFGGSGLGLSICRSLVDLMEGKIWVESDQREGTTFYFTIRLPLTKELPAVRDVPAVVSKETCAPLRILLVEDNPANQKLANYILRDRGHVVDIADNGKDAIRLTEQNRYDVILMDVQMPKMNGLDATLAIRQREEVLHRESRGRRVPIVAMTAHAMKSDRDRCLAAGMDGYLCKPVNRGELIAAVEQAAADGGDAGMGNAGSGGVGDGEMGRHATLPISPSPHLPICSSASPSPTPPICSSADPVPFDLQKALARLDDKLDLFKDMVGFFFSDGLKLLTEIQSAAANGEAKVIEDKAHRLKGTVLYLGADGATRAVDRVESLARSRDLADAAAAMRSMEEEVTRLAAALRDYCPEHK
jgi:two-component system, sensor histidine kinase and response regulator